MASVSAANLSTKAVDRLVSGSLTNNPVPAFSEEVISDKTPRAWADLPEHLLLRVFEFLTRDDEKGRDWVSRAGRVCTAWRRVSKDHLLGDTAASRPKRVQMITSEVHDNKTTLTTKGDLVEESVVNSASEVEACSKRQRIDSSSLHFPALSDDANARNAARLALDPLVPQQQENTEGGSLAMVGSLDVQAHVPNDSVHEGPVAHAALSAEAQLTGDIEDATGGCPSSNETGKCRTSALLGGVNNMSFLNNINTIVKNFTVGSTIARTTSTET